ncbi:arsenic resistance protein [Brevibacterium spongiae]|uniref:Arsenic resistance protein n=1 Tax=Brevibacterium spongiae TaxID=2909672 RepID=A0ABY5SV00_9MICO|nr:arsenic resistance protein [Brevibacterium spongiae]UVI37721.1 arsenic resistance protein [Brevibacterium spongiae]
MSTSIQAAWWVGGLVLGVLLGAGVPGFGSAAEWAVTPCLIVLLFLTFLELPFEAAARAFGNTRFLAIVVGLNFLIVPLVAAGLVTVVDLSQPLLLPVLVVLLSPCIDYVIVFTRAAGGAFEALLALTPVLMVAQLLFLPVGLWAVTGGELSSELPVGPLLEALLLFIVIPLVAAISVRAVSTRSVRCRRVVQASSSLMDPVMTLTLVVIAASVTPVIGDSITQLGTAALVFALFALVMSAVAWATSRAAKLEARLARAAVMSAVTRNSLVMLPIVRAASGDGIGPATMVTQTLVELLFLLLLVRVLPLLTPNTAASENR